MLTSLGLLHMRVKCVIPELYGGYYKPDVSGSNAVCVAMAEILIVMSLCMPDVMVGYG